MARNDYASFYSSGGSYDIVVQFKYNNDYTFTTTTQTVYTNAEQDKSVITVKIKGSPSSYSFSAFTVYFDITLPDGNVQSGSKTTGVIPSSKYDTYDGEYYTLDIGTIKHYNVYASDVFKSNNSTSKTLTYTISISRIAISKMKYVYETYHYSWKSDGVLNIYPRDYQKLANALGQFTYTYNIPPTFNATQLTINPSPAYRNVSTASTTVSSATAYCGGNITSSKLTVGSQTATGSGNGTLTTAKLNTVGTFTPSVVVTDSRGISKIINLNNISVKNVDIPPTFNYSAITFDHDYIYKDFTAASITVSNISVAFDGTITSVKLSIGQQSATRSNAGSLTIDLANSGKFNPVIQVSDSWGLTRSYTLSELTVNAYALPYVVSTEINAQRCLSDGQLDDEGTFAIIALPIHYTKDVAYLTEPIFSVDNTPVSLTWYEDAARQTPVNWEDYQPNSPCTIYALYSYPFEYQNNYTLYFTPTDIDYHDDTHNGATVYAIIPTAYYTVDFRAGGHGVAFGKFAKRDGFDCDMDAYFNNDVLFAVDFNDANDKLAQAIKALGWENKVKVT